MREGELQREANAMCNVVVVVEKESEVRKRVLRYLPRVAVLGKKIDVIAGTQRGESKRSSAFYRGKTNQHYLINFLLGHAA